MLCLGLETASLRPGIGLADENGIILERAGLDPRSKAQAVFVYLNDLLSRGEIELKRLDLIAVTSGPGSFTGLKVGVAAAKGLGFALDLPCVGVSSLEVLASGLADRAPGPIGALFDARRGLIYAALFEPDGKSGLIRLSPDRALPPEDWADELASETRGKPLTLIGRGLDTYGKMLLERLGGSTRLAPEADWDPSPGMVARLGLAAAKAGRTVEAEALEARYLRPVDAVLPKKPLLDLGRKG